MFNHLIITSPAAASLEWWWVLPSSFSSVTNVGTHDAPSQTGMDMLTATIVPTVLTLPDQSENKKNTQK